MLGDCAIEHLLLERLDHLVELLDALLNIAGRKADFPRTFLKVEVLMRWIGLADYLRSHGVCWREYTLLIGDVEVLIGMHLLVVRPKLLHNDSRRLDQIVSRAVLVDNQ